MQKLDINNFGPIPYCSLELKDFMIFIGEQATGKSTICKCVYFFRLVRDEIKRDLHDIISNGLVEGKDFSLAINNRLRFVFNSMFGFTKLQNSFSLQFTYKESISLAIAKSESIKLIKFAFSMSLKDKIKELESFADSEYKILASLDNSQAYYLQLEKNKIFQSIDIMVNDLFNDAHEIFYIPSGRGLISLLTEQQMNIDLKNMDYITSNFLKLIQSNRPSFDVGLNEFIQSDYMLSKSQIINKKRRIDHDIKSILKGEYCYKDDKEYILINEKNYLPINYVSSGQQEIVWILNLLSLWMLENKQIFVVIEEPEAHLYPATQKSIIDYIALFANSNSNQVMITTHSPYILTAANNLLYAGRVGSSNKEVDKVIEEAKWLKIDSFGAFMVGKSHENYIQSIIDDELEEIAAEEIDNVSGDISKTYSAIYNLGVKNEFTK